MSTWTINGTALAALGIVDKAKVTFRSCENDEFEFEVRPADVLAPPIFALNDEVILRKDSTIWFRGVIRELPATGDARTERQRYVARNAWDQLERLVFQQIRNIAQSDLVTLDLAPTSDVILFQRSTGGTFAPIRSDEQLSDVCAYAAAAGVAVTVASGFVGVRPPSENARDLTCAAIIRRILDWHPNVVSWFDYSTDPPTLHFDALANLAFITLDLATAAPRQWQLSLRSDLVPVGVVLNLMYSESNADGSTFTRRIQQTAGSISGVGVIVNTVDMPLDEDGAAQPAPLGPDGSGLTFAQYWYQALSTPFFEGSVDWHDEECPGTARPGKRIAFSGFTRADWSAASSGGLIQSVSEDLFYGRTSAVIGPPRRLTLATVLALGAMRMKQTRRDPKIPPPSPPRHDAQAGGGCFDIELCSPPGQHVRVALCASGQSSV